MLGSRVSTLEAIAFITAKVARGGRRAPGSRPSRHGSRMGGLMASKAKMVRSACEALVLSWSAQPPAEAKASLLETPGWSSPLASEAATQELALSLRDHRDRIGCAIEQQLANRPPGAPSWTPMRLPSKPSTTQPQAREGKPCTLLTPTVPRAPLAVAG